MRAAAPILALATVFVAAPAFAGGSDDPTPYTVDRAGITLPAGRVFQDNGHVNIRWDGGAKGLHFEAKCATRTDAECAGDRHAAAQFIGKSFLPWSAFGLTDECVTWVQISDFNEHYGEGGQPPVCLVEETPCPSPTAPTSEPSKTPEPTSTPSPSISPSSEPTPSVEPTSEPSETPTPSPEPTTSATPSARPSTSPSPSSAPSHAPSTSPSDSPSSTSAPIPSPATSDATSPRTRTTELAKTGASSPGALIVAIALGAVGTVLYLIGRKGKR